MTVHPRISSHRHGTGMQRRELLQVGCLGALGVSLQAAYGAVGAGATGKARSVILVWLPGGPPQMQLWDLKPDSPAECRGSARPIPTSAPGIQFGHWLPKLASQAHHLALLRTLTLHAEDDNHNLGHHKVLAGIDFKPPGSGDFASRHDWPGMGAVAAALRPSTKGLPSSVILPFQVIERGTPLPGQLAGCLGGRYDPWAIEQDPSRPDFRVPDLTPLPALGVERVSGRRRLLDAVDRYRRDLDQELPARLLSAASERAFTVLTSDRTRDAFDLAREPEPLRERYGRHMFGQSLLLARRLVEHGVRFVQVNLGGENHWDFHEIEDRRLGERIPPFDEGFSALLEDLHQRGLLEETLVVCTGEMGRNPRLGAPTAGGTPGVPDGRNHWQWCWTVLLAGAGMIRGAVVGQSDRWSGYPDSEAYTPSDLAATVYTALGIDPRTVLRDLQDRPLQVNDGMPIRPLFA